MNRQVWKNLFSVIALLWATTVAAQFAPAAGLQGSTAIHKDDLSFTEWAYGCTVERGWQNIADTTLGRASAGEERMVVGKAGNGSIVSLGDGGSATVNFQYPVINGTGFDFAVFENGFKTVDSTMAFLEFAFVEVSSDGSNFTRFPVTSYIQDTLQMAMAGVNCALINNVAGRYVANYGTPFDLDELTGIDGLDVNHITHIRMVDVVGNIDSAYTTYDTAGNKINDPWPTAFEASAFDLDAVGVINADKTSDIINVSAGNIQLYPNPVNAGVGVRIITEQHAEQILLTDLNGRVISVITADDKSVRISTAGLSAGMYFINVQTVSQHYNLKLLVQ